MKKIIIMGASSGIGEAIAEAFASRGVRIGIAARRKDRLHALQQKYPGQIIYRTIDITRSDATEHLAELIYAMDGVDLYIHVSGIGYENPTLNPDREAQVLDTNVTGFARMVSYVFDYMRAHGGTGQIVGITSVAGTRGIGDMAAYSASKKCASTYLEALDQLAVNQKLNIHITDIRPGWIRTPLLNDYMTYQMEMPLYEALPLILNAIARRRRVAVIGWGWQLLTSAMRLLPQCVWRRLGALALPEKSESVGN